MDNVTEKRNAIEKMGNNVLMKRNRKTNIVISLYFFRNYKKSKKDFNYKKYEKRIVAFLYDFFFSIPSNDYF